MPDILKDLSAVGDDSIAELFAFINAWNEISTKEGDIIDQFMGMRTLLEVGEAIHLYAMWKERENAKS